MSGQRNQCWPKALALPKNDRTARTHNPNQRCHPLKQTGALGPYQSPRRSPSMSVGSRQPIGCAKPPRAGAKPWGYGGKGEQGLERGCKALWHRVGTGLVGHQTPSAIARNERRLEGGPSVSITTFSAANNASIADLSARFVMPSLSGWSANSLGA